jgi:uncharacterized protein (DUF1778 family)
MATEMPSDVRLDFAVPQGLKTQIEEAASSVGQSVNEFAVAALASSARRVLQQQSMTLLSNCDRDLLLALLDDADLEPPASLQAAAARYRERLG